MLAYTLAGSFKKDVKRMERRGKDIAKLKEVMALIIAEQPLPVRFCNHILHGAYEGKSECHIQPDWLLVYSVNIVGNTVVFYRTGSHSDLF